MTTTHPAKNTTVVFQPSDALYDLIQGFMGVVLNADTYTSANSSLETDLITTTTVYTTTTTIVIATATSGPTESTKCTTPTGCPQNQACFASNDSIQCLGDDTVGFRMMLRSPCTTSSNSSCLLTFVWTGLYSWVSQPCTHLPNSPDLVNLTVSNTYLKADLKYLGNCGPDAFCSPVNNICEPHQPNGTVCDSDLLCIPLNPGRCIGNLCDGSYATTVTVPIRSTISGGSGGTDSDVVAIIVCCLLGVALLFSCVMWCLLCRGEKAQMILGLRRMRHMTEHDDDMPMEQTDGSMAESMVSIEGNQLEVPPPPYSPS